MASIIERTINSVTEQRLVLRNEQIIRPMSIGSNWNTLRIGMRFSIDGDITSSIDSPGNTVFPKLLIGLTASPTNSFGNSSSLNAAGLGLISYYRYIDNSTSSYFYIENSSNAEQFCVYVGSLEQHNNLGSAYYSASFISASPLYYRSAVFFEINKITGSNWTLQAALPSFTASIGQDISLDTFLQSMETDIASLSASLNGYGTYWYSTGSVDEVTNGYLENLTVCWTNYSHPLEISDIAYVKVS